MIDEPFYLTTDPKREPETIPIMVDYPAYFWGGTFPKVGERYALEVYEVGESKAMPGNVWAKLRPVKI